METLAHWSGAVGKGRRVSSIRQNGPITPKWYSNSSGSGGAGAPAASAYVCSFDDGGGLLVALMSRRCNRLESTPDKSAISGYVDYPHDF